MNLHRKIKAAQLITAINTSDAHTIHSLLEEEKVNPNVKNNNGESALHLIIKQKLDLIDLFIQHGADINANNLTGETPLFYALRQYPREKTAELLINHGAALPETCNENILHLAIQQHFTNLARQLLKNNVCPIDAGTRRYGHTALMIACQDNYPEIVELLLKANANIYATNTWGNDAFHEAVFHLHYKNDNRCLKLLRAEEEKRKRQNSWLIPLRALGLTSVLFAVAMYNCY